MNLELPLAPAEQERPLSVRDLVLRAKESLEQLPPCWVEGEVTGFKAYDSGHWYFTLQDRHAAVGCVIWRDDARRAPHRPEDGLKVFARGHFSVNLKSGKLQFTVRQFLPTAEGGWHQVRFEQARAALEKDGLLDPSRKRALPRFPRAIGVITSPEGAVWHDVVAVIERRWPACELVLIGARVQGEDAPREIRRAIELANRCEALDVLILARGGGAREDLAAFNNETVARTVAASRLPIISAVGHEVDVTLTDLVADVRAATPSAAAEAAVPDRADLVRNLETRRVQLGQAVDRRVRLAVANLGWAGERMHSSVQRRITVAAGTAAAAAARIENACLAAYSRREALAASLAGRLDALSPLKVLDRGFAVATAEGGAVLSRVADLPPGRQFRLRVADGAVAARVENR